MTQEQFITELSTANQAFEDLKEELRRLFNAINFDRADEIEEAARQLSNAAKVLEMSARKIQTGINSK
ncbi:MAG TPA: hypothetical protein DHU85_03670 [Porphyromonadaceae bacterium]|uniref:hypothetical protein n=1 Tax=Barnesiella intestinihominis TaxID=487174 RepID=UPI000EC00971|nr:hypothetical protein [Porphyromonadaceae bacterium]